jgi:hypothetical protein
MAGHEKAAYMAGIMDGEGSFTVSMVSMDTKATKRKTHNFVLYIGFTMTDPRIPRWAFDQFGGSAYPQNYKTAKPWHKKAWRWRMATSKAKLEIFLLTVIPYLILKREQAQLLLDFIRLPHGATSEKLSILERIHVLNKRGKSPESNTPDISLIVQQLQDVIQDKEKTAKAIKLMQGALFDDEVKIESELVGDSESDNGVIH